MNNYSVKLTVNPNRIKKDNSCSLYLQVIINRVKETVPLLISWPFKFIDREGGRILPRNKKDPDFSDYNMIILSEMGKINEIFKRYRLRDKVLYVPLFKKEYKGYSLRTNFVEYMAYKISNRRSKNLISQGSVRLHNSSYNRLKEFRERVPFHELDKEFLEDFAAWLKTEHENDDSTIWGRIKDIKAYLELADEDGIGVNESFRNYKNKAPSGRIVYLEDSEINALVTLYNSKSLLKTQHQVLAAFLFSCFSSLRISDVQRANWGWVDVRNYIRFVPVKGQKKNREVCFPLNKIALSFIQRDTGSFFDLPTDVEINRSLKDIAASADIKKNLTFHVSRHTFGTQFYRTTKDIISLQHIMGHFKMDTTMIYVHINEQDKAEGIKKMEEVYTKSLPINRLVS